MSISAFQQAREKYRPANIKVLFITEAPPVEERNRYFYYEHVRRGDSLFLETIKVLFPEEVEAFETVKAIRREKTYFLERLQEEGYYLIGAVDKPLPGKTAAARTNLYRENLPVLMKEILQVARPGTPIVLISAVVFRAIGESLRASGFNVIHDDIIEFPNSGQQLNFRRKLRPLLRENQLLPAPI
ncbi:hypothetical protein OKW21_004828 [Catalinimonas alkaloidigena]|uniref:hypothetical protein n=1 Tax=Catalinimonas alkaloidigena TaxID=1075417 RepID=UPI0024050C80|nr:hypothetical protein [Catalinimonas alkaloidigena]MDF9799565.1 hypothetical protein [Catalinimonas alkaloidigena]